MAGESQIPPQFRRFVKGRGTGVYVTGHQLLVYRSRHSKGPIANAIYRAQSRIGNELEVLGRVHFDVAFANTKRSGIAAFNIKRNIKYELVKLQNGYRIYFGLTRAATTLGNQAVGSRAVTHTKGRPRGQSEAAEGIWMEKGTGIYGLHRRPYPANGFRGTHKHPFLATAKADADPFIRREHTELGRKIQHYVSKGISLD